MSNTKSINLTLILAGAVTLLLGYNLIEAWTIAPANPPGNNTAAPINIAPGIQTKNGDIIANRFAAANAVWSNQYCDKFGNNCFTASDINNVIANSTTTKSCMFQVTTVSGCHQAPNCPTGWNQLGAVERDVAACGNSQDYYTRTCGSNICQ